MITDISAKLLRRYNTGLFHLALTPDQSDRRADQRSCFAQVGSGAWRIFVVIAMNCLKVCSHAECRAAETEWHSICAVSGTAAEEPVVSTKTGYLYEKRLVEKHIKVSVGAYGLASTHCVCNRRSTPAAYIRRTLAKTLYLEQMHL